MVDGPNQVWVADITYIAIAVGFVYMAAILDAWSRRVVASAISRSMDARLADGTDSSERHKHGRCPVNDTIMQTAQEAIQAHEGRLV
jgi:putative transposase